MKSLNERTVEVLREIVHGRFTTKEDLMKEAKAILHEHDMNRFAWLAYLRSVVGMGYCGIYEIAKGSTNIKPPAGKLK